MTLEQARFQAYILKQAGFFDFRKKVYDLITELDSGSAEAVAEQADQLIHQLNIVLPLNERINTPKSFYHGVRAEL